MKPGGNTGSPLGGKCLYVRDDVRVHVGCPFLSCQGIQGGGKLAAAWWGSGSTPYQHALGEKEVE